MHSLIRFCISIVRATVIYCGFECRCSLIKFALEGSAASSSGWLLRDASQLSFSHTQLFIVRLGNHTATTFVKFGSVCSTACKRFHAWMYRNDEKCVVEAECKEKVTSAQPLEDRGNTRPGKTVMGKQRAIENAVKHRGYFPIKGSFHVEYMFQIFFQF